LQPSNSFGEWLLVKSRRETCETIDVIQVEVPGICFAKCRYSNRDLYKGLGLLADRDDNLLSVLRLGGGRHYGTYRDA